MVMVTLLVLFHLHQPQVVVEQTEHNLVNLQEHLVDQVEDVLVVVEVEQVIHLL